MLSYIKRNTYVIQQLISWSQTQTHTPPTPWWCGWQRGGRRCKQHTHSCRHSSGWCCGWSAPRHSLRPLPNGSENTRVAKNSEKTYFHEYTNFDLTLNWVTSSKTKTRIQSNYRRNGISEKFVESALMIHRFIFVLFVWKYEEIIWICKKKKILL